MRPLKLFIPAFLFFLITSGSFVASAKDFLIVDVHFDDGSLLSNAKFKSMNFYDTRIKVKHENEIFTLTFSDIKSIEFVADAGVVTLKIKTKTGVVVNDQFLLNIKNTDLRGGWYCEERRFSFVSKLTGKGITKRYSITNLTQKTDQFRERPYRHYCVFTEHETKAIKSIVFKDGNKKIEEVGK